MTNLHLTDKNGFQREGFTDFLTGPLIYLTHDPVPHLYFSPNPSSTPPPPATLKYAYARKYKISLKTFIIKNFNIL